MIKLSLLILLQYNLLQNATDDTCRFVFCSVYDRYMTQEVCDKVVSKEPFLMITILTIVIRKLLIMFDLWLGIIYIIITKHVKKINKQLMPVGWDPTR